MPTPEDTSQDKATTPANGTGLRFQSIQVERFHGLTHELEVELCAGINVVYGSNAAGKTTLAHAVRALLWPDQVDDPRPKVTGEFRLDGSSWRVDLDGQRCDYLKDRHSESSPALPPPSHARRYHLSLHDLLGGGAEDDGFAQFILQEAQGGIDVEAAAEALGFEIPTRRMSKTARAVQDRRSEVQEAKRQQESLRGDEQRLDALREKRAAAQEAAERAVALDQAIEVARARTEHEEADAALDAFPAVLENVRGDEGEQREALHERLQEAERDIQAAEEQRAEAREALEESRIPEDGLPEGRLQALRTATTTLQEQERTVRQRRTDLEEARDEEDAAWTRLDAGVDREEAAAIDLPAVQTIESHVQAVEDLRGREEALSTAEALFADAAPEVSVETLREGLRRLHRWLQAPSPDTSEGWDIWRLFVVASGVLVGGGGLLLLGLEGGILFWLGAVLAFLGVVIVVAEFMRRTSASDSDRRALHAREFERTGLEGPDTWSEEDVEQHADRLLDRLRDAAVDAEKQKVWDRLQPKREEVSATAEDLEAERARLAHEVGVDPDVSSRSLAWLLDRLSQWQTAYDEREAQMAALDTAEEEAVSCRERLEDLLSPYDLGPVKDASAAQGALDAMESAREAFREAQRDLEQATETKQSAEANRAEAKEELAALYDRLDLDDGSEEELRSLVEQHEAYEQAVEAERTARTTLETEVRQLRRCEGFEEWMADAAEDDLIREREAACTEADREEAYLDEIKDIEHAIEDAREGGTLEQRRAEYRQSRDALADDRDRDYDRAVGRVIADLVQTETRDQGLPPVFHRARELFAEITNDRYQLQLDRERGTFRAYDHVCDRPFSLEALSSGTKVQLLLSVRVAFVETQEQGCRAPLVLDETLANSDAERARAIIDAVRTICRRGRQVLYLTAQADEVHKWRVALEDDETVDHTVITLSDLDLRDRPSTGDGAPVPSRRTPTNLPDPETTTHGALREVLSVPSWTPRQSVTRLHLWYLLESPAPLLNLIDAGTRTWGQLRFQHQRGGLVATGLAEDTFQSVRALAHAVESWQEAWQVGRGRPVDHSALEQTDAVTENFIDGVSDLADDLDGDAEALLRALRDRSDERVSGFRSAKADELEVYLRDNGFLDPRDRHAPAEMWQYVLADLARDREKGHVDLEDLERLFERLQGETPRPSAT